MSWLDELIGSVQQQPQGAQTFPLAPQTQVQATPIPPGQQGQNPMQNQQDMMMMAQALRGMGQQQPQPQGGRVVPASDGIDFQSMMGPAISRQFGGQQSRQKNPLVFDPYGG